MKSFNLEKILTFELKEQINNFVSEYVGGKEHQILYGKVFIPVITSEKDIVVDTIVRTVCECFHVPREIVLSETRKIPFITYRQYITYFLYQYLNISLTEIGAIVSIDHATVIHTNKVVGNYLCTNKQKREEIKQIENTLNVILWENK